VAPAGASRAPENASAAVAVAPPIASHPAEVAPPLAPPPAAPTTAVTVGHGIVLTCRTEDGDVRKGVAGCGSLGGFDAVARPRLAKLASCGATSGASGKLSAVFSLDFKTNHVGVDVGKSSTVPNTEGVGACLRGSFQGVSLGPIQHDQVKYAVVYSVTFAPSAPAAPVTPGDATPSPGSSPSPPPPGRTAPPSAPASIAAPVAPAPTDDGSAQVVWEVALVRDAPRTGQVVARLARGTKVRLGAGEDGWYKVQFGQSFGTEGYVYRGAIGK